MRKVIFLMVAVIGLMTSCATVDSGHKGVEVSWGGKTNLQEVYSEGMHSGAGWLFNDMIEYDVREKTLVQKFEFNDKNNMVTVVELSLDYNLTPDKVNFLHSKITDVDAKIVKTLKSAGKEVVPQYSAVELNISKRTEAEALLSKILSEELPEFYVDFARIQMTDVDIPRKVADLAEQTAVQIGKNELAEKMELEKQNLAKAKVAEAQGNYDAAVLDAQTKKLLSTPDQLKLLELQVEMEYAKLGKSKYGENNIFGAQTAVVRGLN